MGTTHGALEGVGYDEAVGWKTSEHIPSSKSM
jgi:hypothetical protein